MKIMDKPEIEKRGNLDTPNGLIPPQWFFDNSIQTAGETLWRLTRGGKPAFEKYIEEQVRDPEYQRKIADWRTSESARPPGREIWHVIRLLRPMASDEEKAFGKAFIDYGYDAYLQLADQKPHPPEMPNDHRIIHSHPWRVINGESSPDITLWWTMAPYIFVELTKMGVRDEEAIKQIIKWADSGETNDSREETDHPKDTYGINLEGLSTKVSTQFFLDRFDQNHASHMLARKLAADLVEQGIFR